MNAIRLAAFVTLLPLAALAAGIDDSDSEPEPTETSEECEDGEVWDSEAQECVEAQDDALNDDQRFEAVRELAYHGRPESALLVLAAMREGETDRVLTYLGFAHRKAGDRQAGLAYYEKALTQNPDNILARSYLGQLYVEMSLPKKAAAELAEIRARGGAGTWPETSLQSAIATGRTYNY